MDKCCRVQVCDRCGVRKNAGLMSPYADGWPSNLCLECERQLGWFKEKCRPCHTPQEA